MQVRTFTGKSTSEIMARIKSELGPDAIILSNQKQSRKGAVCYEIMAALDVPPSRTSAAQMDMSLAQDDARTSGWDSMTRMRSPLPRISGIERQSSQLGSWLRLTGRQT